MAQTCQTVQVLAAKPIVIIDNVKSSATTAEIGNTITLTALVVNQGLAPGTVTVIFKKGTVIAATAAPVIIPAQKSVYVTSPPVTILLGDSGKALNFCAEAQCLEC
jgi:hypothetical protein